jgi:predicted Fe-Mo cluster-binding NifX family protein
MKVAVPTRGAMIDDHFGHCEAYTIYRVNEQQEIDLIQTLPSPQGCGCKSNIASVLQEMGVTVMIAGNMGNGALNVLNNHGIEVVRGNSGEAAVKVGQYIRGELKDSGEVCNHHDKDHQCSH